jgi:L-lactate dehydrogenase (cytochrome)
MACFSKKVNLLDDFNTNYALLDDIIAKAKKKIPKFSFEYLDGGCNENINLVKNTAELREVELIP